jgi:REP element-mobilizing transposase RayT
VLLYHYVCPAKYRRAIFSKEVTETLVRTCKEISDRYEIFFLEIGTDKNHVHFLIQSVPRYSPTEIIKKVKSITARQIFEKHPEVKKQLWGGEIWTDGYFVNTVSKYGNEEVIAKYLQRQGTAVEEYVQLHKINEIEQLSLY